MSILRISVIVSFLMLFANTSAQTHYNANISVGAKGGVDFSRMFFNPSVPQKMKLGAVGGLTFRYVEENHFGLIAELNIEQRGWNEKFEEVPYEYNRTFTYLQIPILAHIYFGAEKVRFFLNAGPEIGFLLGESINSNFDINNIESLSDFPIVNRNNLQYKLSKKNKVDYGISAGLGGEVFINKRNSITIEGRFYYGLGNVYKSGRTELFNATNSMSVMATVGWWFRIK